MPCAFQNAPVPLLVHDGAHALAWNNAFAVFVGSKEPPVSLDSIFAASDGLRGRGETTLRGDGQPVTVQSAPLDAERWVVQVQPANAVDQAVREVEERGELRRLKETNEFKTQILNTTAHELNTPLTPVRLQLHLLKSGALGALQARQERAVGIVDRNVERLSFLINDILDVARLESGRVDVNPRPIRLAEALMDGVESFEETAARVGVALALEADEGLIVNADPERVMQVLYNLVGNAIKFTPAGGRVHVSAHGEPGCAVVDVVDSGPGLEPVQIEQLFQPFSRVHDTEHSTVAGTGLGLYICRGLIEAHGGTIQAISAGHGHGSTFRFTLPLGDADAILEPTRRNAHKPIDPLARRLRELI